MSAPSDHNLTRVQPVLIVGMHRSGTSCLAGCLEDLGLHLGAVNTSSPFNQKGNRENPSTWPLHDTILRRAGSTWDNPPSGVVSWTKEDVANAIQLLQPYLALPEPWGFKDPRATLLIDGWASVVPRIRIVATVRNPAAVAKSLSARNGFDEHRSLELWSHYNQAILRWHTLTNCPIVNYDAPDYEQTVRGVAATLGLAAERPMVFRSSELNHHGSHPRLPASVAELWHKLMEVAE